MEQMSMFDTHHDMSSEPRLFGPQEMALMCQVQRAARGWSQEALAELSGLTVRTVQRVEAGQSSSADTRRALARAFGTDDIDVFNKRQVFKTAEEFEAEQRRVKEQFEREYVTMDARPVTGRDIARLGEDAGAACVELSEALVSRREVEDVHAQLKDYVRDFIDIAGDVSATERLSFGDDIQRLVEDLGRLGCSVVGGKRKVKVQWGGTGPHMDTTAVYLLVVEKGKEPGLIAIPRAAVFT